MDLTQEIKSENHNKVEGYLLQIFNTIKDVTHSLNKDDKVKIPIISIRKHS